MKTVYLSTAMLLLSSSLLLGAAEPYGRSQASEEARTAKLMQLAKSNPALMDNILENMEKCYSGGYRIIGGKSGFLEVRMGDSWEYIFERADLLSIDNLLVFCLGSPMGIKNTHEMIPFDYLPEFPRNNNGVLTFVKRNPMPDLTPQEKVAYALAAIKDLEEAVSLLQLGKTQDGGKSLLTEDEKKVKYVERYARALSLEGYLNLPCASQEQQKNGQQSLTNLKNMVDSYFSAIPVATSKPMTQITTHLSSSSSSSAPVKNKNEWISDEEAAAYGASETLEEIQQDLIFLDLSIASQRIITNNFDSATRVLGRVEGQINDAGEHFKKTHRGLLAQAQLNEFRELLNTKLTTATTKSEAVEAEVIPSSSSSRYVPALIRDERELFADYRFTQPDTGFVIITNFLKRHPEATNQKLPFEFAKPGRTTYQQELDYWKKRLKTDYKTKYSPLLLQEETTMLKTIAKTPMHTPSSTIETKLSLLSTFLQNHPEAKGKLIISETLGGVGRTYGDRHLELELAMDLENKRLVLSASDSSSSPEVVIPSSSLVQAPSSSGPVRPELEVADDPYEPVHKNFNTSTIEEAKRVLRDLFGIPETDTTQDDILLEEYKKTLA